MHAPSLRPRHASPVLAILLAATTAGTRATAAFPPPYNSETSTHLALPPTAALASIRLPQGLAATLFAAEPDVQNPIAMTTDSRGRLWVAENYTYAERDVIFDPNLRDRILILEDTDHDGRFDKRTVFWDDARILTSIELGQGGVWALCPPQLLFIPDRNRDDIPDSPPVPVLDGWDSRAVRHNIANGLKWGPDGWLYGRHGILASSLVGTPGSPAGARTRVNCGVWRFHPFHRTFEIVASGTTNPWGMDWDEHGHPFIINTVIGHLWHIIPGAHFRRMYGEDPNPYTFGLLEQHADHFHWDTRETWSDVRKLGVTATSSTAGGGHAHSGLLIYQGGQFPPGFQNRAITINLHGRRLNMDRLDRTGSGFVGRHESDPVFFGDPWFRGVELIAADDGGVFVADWSDTGECHEQDGVHRTSGRIFKLTATNTPTRPPRDLESLDDDALVALHQSSNEWEVRHSRQILADRAASGRLKRAAVEPLVRTLRSYPNETARLRALWLLHNTGEADDSTLLSLLDDSGEHVRAWSIQLLADRNPGREPVVQRWIQLASQDRSLLVRLHLTAALQKLPHPARLRLAPTLLSHATDAADPNLPLMAWYGIEPLAASFPTELAALSRECAIPLVRRFIARRLASDPVAHRLPIQTLLTIATDTDDDQRRLDLLNGLADGMAGLRRVAKPEGWDVLQRRHSPSIHPGLSDRIRDLASLFGDGRALDELRKLALDNAASAALRRRALETLVESRPTDLRSVCEKLLSVHEVNIAAVAGLTHVDDPAAADAILGAYPAMYGHERQAALTALASRPEFARRLVNGLRRGFPGRQDLTAVLARQIRSLGIPELTRDLADAWGTVRESPGDRQALIRELKARLTSPSRPRANRSEGRVLFLQLCAPCHTLHGDGARIGPDLTGAGRDNLDYLLENIVDPSAVVAADFRLTTVTLADGRILNGVVVAQTPIVLTLQTASDRVVVDRREISTTAPSNLSLMPDGLIDQLSEIALANLFAYLQSQEQVPLP